MIRIIVCVKQVPDIAEAAKVKVDRDSGHLLREGVQSIVNPFDEYAIEEALQLAEKQNGEVIAISMGPVQAKDALIHCLAMGAHKAFLLSDKVFAGADTLATSYTLARAIRKIGDFHLILCGKAAIDGETAQVGPGIAENLHIPQITCVNRVEIDGESVKAWQETEWGQAVIEARLPILVTALKGVKEPRVPTFSRLADAMEEDIPIWSADDLNGDLKRFGLEGSATRVVKTWTPERRKRGRLLEGEPGDLARMLAGLLRDKEGSY
jgi:electron transfer flavoprotein alpha/beta subunit